MDNLYRDEIMDIYKNPQNRGTLAKPTVLVTETNPFCGDKLTLALLIEKNIIKDAKFEGEACAIGVISSSFLTENVIGKTVADAKKVTKEQLLDMIGLNLTTSRVKCATLILDALQKALKSYEEKNK